LGPRKAFHLYLSPCPALHPIIVNNPRSSRITAAAGTQLAGASYSSTVIIHPRWKGFTVKWPSSPTQFCWIKLSLIVQYSWLLAQYELGPCFSSDVTDQPLSPVKDLRFGELLSHQQI